MCVEGGIIDNVVLLLVSLLVNLSWKTTVTAEALVVPPKEWSGDNAHAKPILMGRDLHLLVWRRCLGVRKPLVVPCLQ